MADRVVVMHRGLIVETGTVEDIFENPQETYTKALLAAVLCAAAGTAGAHGDVVPQAVDVSSLPPLGEEWLEVNPYRENDAAIRLGDSAFNQNCARCHGLGAVSGGIAPDLRYLPTEDEGDEIFMQRIRHGASRDGRVFMPPFEGILPQEAMWAIRAWLETVHEE
jgi:cytochrome c-550 PedF